MTQPKNLIQLDPFFPSLSLLSCHWGLSYIFCVPWWCLSWTNSIISYKELVNIWMWTHLSNKSVRLCWFTSQKVLLFLWNLVRKNKWKFVWNAFKFMGKSQRNIYLLSLWWILLLKLLVFTLASPTFMLIVLLLLLKLVVVTVSATPIFFHSLFLCQPLLAFLTMHWGQNLLFIYLLVSERVEPCS